MIERQTDLFQCWCEPKTTEWLNTGSGDETSKGGKPEFLFSLAFYLEPG